MTESTQTCCEAMKRWSQPCEQHRDDPMECPDRLIHRSSNGKLVGIRIHDGGSSFAVIASCPWCRTDLDVEPQFVSSRMIEVSDD